MKAAVLSRMMEVLPRMVPQIVEKEAAALQKQAEAVIAGSAQKSESVTPKQAVASDEPNRNDIVTITNGTETKEIKYKKATEFLANGWVLQK